MRVLAANAPRLGYREFRWLMVALVAHALVLLIPVERMPWSGNAEPARLLVRLVSGLASLGPESSESVSGAPPAVVPPQVSTPTELAVPEGGHEPQEIPIEPADVMADSPDGITTARLIELRDSFARRVPLAKVDPGAALKLGAPGPFQRPGNWRPLAGAQALAPFGNVFNGRTVPEEVEIVDQWLAADGSQNAIIETPAGLRLCGRTMAWDPARPLIEPVMQWQVCGGDFARPFEYKPRQRPDRNFIVPVAKETTTP